MRVMVYVFWVVAMAMMLDASLCDGAYTRMFIETENSAFKYVLSFL